MKLALFGLIYFVAVSNQAYYGPLALRNRALISDPYYYLLLSNAIQRHPLTYQQEQAPIANGVPTSRISLSKLIRLRGMVVESLCSKLGNIPSTASATITITITRTRTITSSVAGSTATTTETVTPASTTVTNTVTNTVSTTITTPTTIFLTSTVSTTITTPTTVFLTSTVTKTVAPGSNTNSNSGNGPMGRSLRISVSSILSDFAEEMEDLGITEISPSKVSLESSIAPQVHLDDLYLSIQPSSHTIQPSYIERVRMDLIE